MDSPEAPQGTSSPLSPVSILNRLAGKNTSAAVSTEVYGATRRHGLDIYRAASSESGSPVVIFFYGGGWEEGERGDYFFVGAALAECGFVTVIADYRVYPEVRFPGFVEDAALAVGWVRDHIAAFGGDPRRIVLMGHSAGAHIAALLAFDRNWLAPVGLEPLDIAGLVGLAGPYDFLPLRSERLKDIFGTGQTLFRSQPINFARPPMPPAFLATGRADKTVDPGNTVRLARRIREEGGHVETRLYRFVGHRTIAGAMAFPLRFLAPVLKDSAVFIRRVTTRNVSEERAVAVEGTPCPS